MPPPLLLDGAPLEREAEATVLLLRGFRDTVVRGPPPLVPVRDTVAVSLIGVAGAESLARGSQPVAVPQV